MRSWRSLILRHPPPADESFSRSIRLPRSMTPPCRILTRQRSPHITFTPPIIPLHGRYRPSRRHRLYRGNSRSRPAKRVIMDMTNWALRFPRQGKEAEHWLTPKRLRRRGHPGQAIWRVLSRITRIPQNHPPNVCPGTLASPM